MELGIILEGSDWKLSRKLRTEDPEQFYTLVRMHLSFVLDLTTEDSECPAEKDKLRQLLKWGLAPFMKRTRTASKSNSEGQPLTKQGIAQINRLIEFLSKDENISQEGIFRRSGKLTRQQELKSLLIQNQNLNLESGQFSVHDCASVFKGFLADLAEPLLTEAYYPAYCQIAELCILEKSSERLLCALQLLLLLLPEENWLMLKDVIMMLNLTASHEGQNKMSAENLATLFTPHLLCPRKLSPEALHSNAQMLSHVVIFMIRSGLELFQVPPTLATDIYAYWERKKLSSQTVEVTESTAANTVFSFVDRERTAKENTTNPTEAALAQLYAYIQSLPESNKKRRLVKQFNKENGHGTPRHGTSRACSIGDSIKKRIFNKSSKNPKPLLESNLIKSGRSSSEEILDSPEYMKNVTPTKIQLKLEENCEDADSSVDKSETSYDKLEELSHNDKENIENSLDGKYTTVSAPSENANDGLQSLLPVLSSPFSLCTSFASKPIYINTSASLEPVTTRTVTSTEHVEQLSSSTPENKIKFFTPPTPVSLKHRHWSIGKASCSTPNTKQWANINSLLLTSTPACNNCLLSTSPMVASADDMSPITRSTQRMTKAMQETMMTPRSRKPVVALSGSNICHLANMTWGVKDSSWSSNEKQDGNVKQQVSYEEDSITSPFRDYLLSRSILTTSPVDLSFSSRTGDFDPSSFSDDILTSPINGSLLHCMNGNCVGSSSDSDSFGPRKRDGSALDNEMISKRERSSSTSGHSTDSSKEAVFETSL